MFFFAGMTVIHAEELPPKFVAADANKDGKLSMDEVDACVNKRLIKGLRNCYRIWMSMEMGF